MKTLTEHRGRELAEIGKAGLRAASGIEFALAEIISQPVLTFGILPIEDGARLDQRRGGDHEAVRLDEAESFQVGAGVGVGSQHGA